MSSFHHETRATKSRVSDLYLAEFLLPDGTWHFVRKASGAQAYFDTEEGANSTALAQSRNLERKGLQAAAIFAKAREDRKNAR